MESRTVAGMEIFGLSFSVEHFALLPALKLAIASTTECQLHFHLDWD
jgi:hypothetical protein